MLAESRFPAIAVPGRRDLLRAILSGSGAAALIVLQAWLLSGIIDRAFLHGATIPGLFGMMAAFAGVAILRAAATWATDVLGQRAATTAKAALRASLVDQTIQLGPRGLAGERTGEIANTLAGGVETLDGYVGQYLPQTALAVIVPVVVGAAVLWADPLSALVLILTYPLIPVFMVLIGGAARERTRRQWLQLSRLSVRFLDAVQGLTTLKSLGRNHAETASIERSSERFREMTMGVLRVAFLSALVLELLATLSTAIVAVEVGLRLLYGRIAFGPALFVLMLAPEFYRPLRALGVSFHAGMAGREAEARARALLALPVSRSTAPTASDTVADLAGPPSIQFDAVTYAYAPDRSPALERVTFRIDAGTTLAIAGPSGAGKTTIAHLLLRFFEPDAGSIVVNGRPLQSVDAVSWRARIAWVSQRPYLFHGTVLDNLRLARPAATRAQIEEAISLAHADPFIAELPDGLETPIGEQGERLSGGQAQRLALARAFLRDSPIVVLDEPTSQLDPRHEQLVVDSVRRLASGRTVLLIAHRVATLAGADRIVMISAGRVVESGRPADLARAGGLYSGLVAARGPA